MAAQPTSNISFQNFFSATLTADITATSTDIFLDNIPNGTEGFLVIDPLSTSGHEIIYYNSKGASKVTCPSIADGRGQDDTNASSHLTGTTVIMAPVAAYYETLLSLFTTSPQGWSSLAGTFTANTYNGNRSYTVSTSTDQSAVLSPGMRLRSTCTVAGPVQCASLNGTNQFFNRATTINGMTWTDDFVAGAWVKLSSYTQGTIISRYNGTSGWWITTNADGTVKLVGFNGGGGNFSQVQSIQAVPLNRWVHIVAQLDMSGFSTTPTGTVSYMMFDGVDIPTFVARGGTNPASLLQAGNLEVGSVNGGTSPFPGKIAQAFVTSAKLTQTQVRAIYSQGLTAADMTTYNIVSAYSLSGATGANDINTANANNLTPNGSATTTTNDSFRGQNASGIVSSNLDYAIVTAVTSSTITYQVPEGCTVPTSSGISAMGYSTYKAPYGFVADKTKYSVVSFWRGGGTSPTGTTWSNTGSIQLNVPTGNWRLAYRAYASDQTSNNVQGSVLALLPGSGIAISPKLTGETYTSSGVHYIPHCGEDGFATTTATPVYLNVVGNNAGAQVGWEAGYVTTNYIEVEPAHI